MNAPRRPNRVLDSIPGPPPGSLRCWLGATTEAPLRSDVHLSGHLCARCWAVQPRGRSEWARAAEALAVALDLTRREWRETFRTGWLERVARKHGVLSWHDTRNVPAPDEPFGWIPADVLTTAASELADMDAAFARSRYTGTPPGPTAPHRPVPGPAVSAPALRPPTAPVPVPAPSSPRAAPSTPATPTDRSNAYRPNSGRRRLDKSPHCPAGCPAHPPEPPEHAS